MRQFSAEYLADTRAGLWTDREALAALDLPNRERILDVGCGTGEFAAVLREESPAEVICLDADRRLIQEVGGGPRLLGDATRLPLRDAAVDLATCQALLVNLPQPIDAVRELARVSSSFVAVVEPDNSEVTVESTVAAEVELSAQARAAYLDGLETDATLGGRAANFLREAGLREVTTTRHELVREITPPYSPRAIEAAKRKVTASRLREQEPEIRAGGTSAAEFDSLLERWRTMGRSVVSQMRADEYRRTETVPFYVTVGRV